MVISQRGSTKIIAFICSFSESSKNILLRAANIHACSKEKVHTLNFFTEKHKWAYQGKWLLHCREKTGVQYVQLIH